MTRMDCGRWKQIMWRPFVSISTSWFVKCTNWTQYISMITHSCTMNLDHCLVNFDFCIINLKLILYSANERLKSRKPKRTKIDVPLDASLVGDHQSLFPISHVFRYEKYGSEDRVRLAFWLTIEIPLIGRFIFELLAFSTVILVLKGKKEIILPAVGIPLKWLRSP